MNGIKQVTAVMMLLLAAMPVLAENRIGVVNLREAVFSSDAGSEFGDVIQGELKKEQESIKALEDEAKELQKRLKTDGSMMNESERSDLESKFQQKAREYQQRRARFEQAVISASNSSSSSRVPPWTPPWRNCWNSMISI